MTISEELLYGLQRAIIALNSQPGFRTPDGENSYRLLARLDDLHLRARQQLLDPFPALTREPRPPELREPTMVGDLPDPFSRWMVARVLERVQEEGPGPVLERLRDAGWYPSVADEVERILAQRGQPLTLGQRADQKPDEDDGA